MAIIARLIIYGLWYHKLYFTEYAFLGFVQSLKNEKGVQEAPSFFFSSGLFQRFGCPVDCAEGKESNSPLYSFNLGMSSAAATADAVNDLVSFSCTPALLSFKTMLLPTPNSKRWSNLQACFCEFS